MSGSNVFWIACVDLFFTDPGLPAERWSVWTYTPMGVHEVLNMPFFIYLSFSYILVIFVFIFHYLYLSFKTGTIKLRVILIFYFFLYSSLNLVVSLWTFRFIKAFHVFLRHLIKGRVANECHGWYSENVLYRLSCGCYKCCET